MNYLIAPAISRLKNSIPMLFTFWVAVLCACSADADPTLDRGLRNMAAKIAQLMENEGMEKRIVVGDFIGSPRMRASGGIEISRAISNALKNVGITPDEDANAQLLGKFKRVVRRANPDDSFDSNGLFIEATLLDVDDEEIAIAEVTVFGSPLLQIAGATVGLPPTASEEQRQRAVSAGLRNSQTVIQSDRVYSNAGSPFGISLSVAGDPANQIRKPVLDSKRRAMVELHRGEEYIVGLHNDADHECAVTLLIDGVDMFVDAKDASKSSRIILGPGQSASIPGWYFTKTRSKAFEIGGYEQSVAKRVGNSTGTGSVTAIFRACWSPDAHPPANEPGGRSKGGKATTQGRDISKDYQSVTKQFGILRSVVTIRYDR
ncbi:MAG: hypothetical protein AAFP90_03345 [Planctomycetota bacterium]